MNILKSNAAWVFWIAAAMAGAVLVAASLSADPATKQAMKFKLHYSQRVLEGIATENFDLIVTNAASLARLSQFAGWEVRQTPDYQRLTADFNQAAENLKAAALKNNVDRATVAYFQLTVSCVSCHRYLRDAKMAALP